MSSKEIPNEDRFNIIAECEDNIAILNEKIKIIRDMKKDLKDEQGQKNE